jgi:transaldolase
MPEATMQAVADHGEIVGDTVKPYIADAAQVFLDIEALGIDMADVFSVLETEGVDKFIVAWEELLGTIETALQARGEADVS